MKDGYQGLGSIQRELHRHGLRATPQRLAVGAMLLRGPVHVTAREVWQSLRRRHPAISLNTIYQTLGQFEAKGLVQRLEVGGVSVFDSNMAPHDHVWCERCHAIEDVPAGVNAPGHDGETWAPPGWRIAGVRRVWVGVCPACRAGEAASGAMTDEA